MFIHEERAEYTFWFKLAYGIPIGLGFVFFSGKYLLW